MKSEEQRPPHNLLYSDAENAYGRPAGANVVIVAVVAYNKGASREEEDAHMASKMRTWGKRPRRIHWGK